MSSSRVALHELAGRREVSVGGRGAYRAPRTQSSASPRFGSRSAGRLSQGRLRRSRVAGRTPGRSRMRWRPERDARTTPTVVHGARVGGAGLLELARSPRSGQPQSSTGGDRDGRTCAAGLQAREGDPCVACCPTGTGTGPIAPVAVCDLASVQRKSRGHIFGGGNDLRGDEVGRERSKGRCDVAR